MLLISAAGLVALGAITYAEQRSFLTQRVDQQARAATRAVAHVLGGDDDPGAATTGPGYEEPPGASQPDTVPSGTYGELRSASGTVLARGSCSPTGTTATATAPQMPAGVRSGDLRTTTAGGTRYRVAVSGDPESGGLVVAAVPLREVDQTLHRLLIVEALVIGGVLGLLGLVSWLVVRLGLRPLDRMGQTAGAIAEGDLAQRVADTDARTEVSRWGGR